MDLGPDPTEDEVAAWLAQLPPEKAWQWRAPPMLMPVPAADVQPLTGQRVVVFDRDHNHDHNRSIWVYGQWAVTEPHDRDGETVVGLLDEADWYRHQREPEHVVVPRSHPLSGLWVELPQDLGNVARPQPDYADVRRSLRTTSIVADLTRPPVRWLRFGMLETELTGSRCWVLTPEGPQSAWRVCGEPRRGSYTTTINFNDGLDGLDKPVIGTLVPACPEDAWYRWRQTGEPPEVTLYATQFVWLE